MTKETDQAIEETNKEITEEINALVTADVKDYGRVKYKTQKIIERLEEDYII